MSDGLQVIHAQSLRTRNTFGIDATTPLALRIACMPGTDVRSVPPRRRCSATMASAPASPR